MFVCFAHVLFLIIMLSKCSCFKLIYIKWDFSLTNQAINYYLQKCLMFMCVIYMYINISYL